MHDSGITPTLFISKEFENICATPRILQLASTVTPNCYKTLQPDVAPKVEGFLRQLPSEGDSELKENPESASSKCPWYNRQLPPKEVRSKTKKNPESAFWKCAWIARIPPTVTSKRSQSWNKGKSESAVRKCPWTARIPPTVTSKRNQFRNKEKRRNRHPGNVPELRGYHRRLPPKEVRSKTKKYIQGEALIHNIYVNP